MAIVTIVKGEFTFEGAAVRFELDIDDANGNITAVRCVNESTADVGVEVIQGEGRPNAGRTTTKRRLGPGTTEFVIPTGAAQRIRGFWDAARQRWNGIEVRFLVPWVE